jgi:tetratricopeptide (TPR) repeat protein
MTSAYVQHEIAEALRLRQMGPKPLVIPLVVGATRLAGVPHPFDQLTKLRYYTCQPDGDVEETVARVCRDLAVTYRPLPADDPRFPVLSQFEAEISGNVPRRTARDIAVYDRLQRAIGEFREAFQAGRLRKASDVITYVIGTCEYEFPRDVFYYPYVVRAVCALLQDRLVELPPILDVLRDHPKRDEHYPALLGMLSFRQGAFNDASRHFRAAFDETERRGHAGASALAWLVQTHLHLNAPIMLSGVLESLDAAETHTEAERKNLERLVAFAEARLGSPERAEVRLRALIARGKPDADVLGCLALVMDRLGRTEEARGLLETHCSELGDHELYRQTLGSLCFRTGRFHQALEHFLTLVAREPPRRQYFADAIEVLWGMGRVGQARELASTVLDSRRFGPPTTPNDFFIDGLANFVLDRRERAEYDRERSGVSRDCAELLAARRRACGT